MGTDMEAVFSHTRHGVGRGQEARYDRRHFMNTLVNLSTSWAKSLGKGTSQANSSGRQRHEAHVFSYTLLGSPLTLSLSLKKFIFECVCVCETCLCEYACTCVYVTYVICVLSVLHVYLNVRVIWMWYVCVTCMYLWHMCVHVCVSNLCDMYVSVMYVCVCTCLCLCVYTHMEARSKL